MGKNDTVNLTKKPQFYKPQCWAYYYGHSTKHPLNMYFSTHRVVRFSDLIRECSLCYGWQLTRKFTWSVTKVHPIHIACLHPKAWGQLEGQKGCKNQRWGKWEWNSVFYTGQDHCTHELTVAVDAFTGLCEIKSTNLPSMERQGLTNPDP